MKFYNSLGPNPRVVRMVMAEKGIDIPKVEIDIMSAENRGETYKKLNPAGQMPCLELEDGTVLAEITALAEYLDELHPEPPLIGTTPEERAITRMWTRRIDLNIVENLANGFRYAEGLPLFKDRIHTIPQAADDLKAITREKLEWLDGLIDGREWIAGDRFTLADILLFAFLDFAGDVGQPLDTKNKNISAWLERVRKRPSAEASK